MTIRIVVWNCAKAFHEKTDRLLSLRPDVAIVPESAHPEIVQRKNGRFAFTDADWIGSNKNSGLGIYSFNGLSIHRHDSWCSQFSHFLPVEVRGSTKFTLLAVHALSHHKQPRAVTNPRTTLEALGHYSSLLGQAPSVVAGDFNANIQWDAKNGTSRFADVHSKLERLGFSSAYHTHKSESFGKETEATIYWRRKIDAPYHIDYLYVSQLAAHAIRDLEVGEPNSWLESSDHMPLTAEVQL